jgi:NAD(P)H dehydrogenase (quinone)
MASQMKNFLDQTGGLWAQDKLVGKVGARYVAETICARRDLAVGHWHATHVVTSY